MISGLCRGDLWIIQGFYRDDGIQGCIGIVSALQPATRKSSQHKGASYQELANWRNLESCTTWVDMLRHAHLNAKQRRAAETRKRRNQKS